MKASYKHKSKPKRFPGKMKIEIVVDTSEYDKWYEGLTEREKTDYWNKECKKGESSL